MDKQLERAIKHDRALADALWHAECLDVAERSDNVIATAMRARNRLGRVLTLRGQAIVYGRRNAHPFDERLSIDKLFGMDHDLLAALLRPHRRKTSPNVDLPLVARNARRACELIEEQQAHEDATGE